MADDGEKQKNKTKRQTGGGQNWETKLADKGGKTVDKRGTKADNKQNKVDEPQLVEKRKYSQAEKAWTNEQRQPVGKMTNGNHFQLYFSSTCPSFFSLYQLFSSCLPFYCYQPFLTVYFSPPLLPFFDKSDSHFSVIPISAFFLCSLPMCIFSHPCPCFCLFLPSSTFCQPFPSFVYHCLLRSPFLPLSTVLHPCPYLFSPTLSIFSYLVNHCKVHPCKFVSDVNVFTSTAVHNAAFTSL